MKPVMQTIFTPPKGDCFRACVATILELDLAAVPNWIGDHPEDWFDRFQAWLLKRGLAALEIPITPDQPFFSPLPPAPFILTGQSPRGDWLHCVVGVGANNRFDYVHDPNPHGGYLAAYPVFVMFFLPLKPEEVKP